MTALRMGELFAGYGGLGMGVAQVLDVDLAWVSEIERAPSRILAHRWPGVPNLGDITAVDWSQVEPVDVLTGGFPCQDVSAAGKRAGLKPDTRTGLWSHMAHAIDQLRPSLVVAENVRGLLSAAAHSDVEPCPWCMGDADGEPDMRALGAVLADLADLGYDAAWYGLRAADVGAPHGRYRVFILATDTRSGTGRVVTDQRGIQRSGPVDLQIAAEPTDLGHERPRQARDGRTGPADGRSGRARPDAGGRGRAPIADTAGDGRHEGRAESAQLERGPDAAEPRPLWAEPWDARCNCCRRRNGHWGPYEPAIRRWEHITGRPAPAPTESGPRSGDRLSPRFVEWMMGLPDGWVTDVPGISRNDMLKALGNGVVPQQAAAAISRLMAADRWAVAS